jgi:hypothetical protein
MLSTGIVILTLYRGIAVPVTEVAAIADAIRKRGLLGTEGRWKFSIPDVDQVRRRLADMAANPRTSRSDILEPSCGLAICACGHPEGGAFYAIEHNGGAGTAPLLISFRIPDSRVYVDCRDFLCTAFQLWDREGIAGQARQREILSTVFGSAVVRYFNAACNTTDQAIRIAQCNLAAFDPAVLAAHYKNRLVIAGRYRTRFASAFFVASPISPNEVVDVFSPSVDLLPSADLTLESFLALGNGGNRPSGHSVN